MAAETPELQTDASAAVNADPSPVPGDAEPSAHWAAGTEQPAGTIVIDPATAQSMGSVPASAVVSGPVPPPPAVPVVTREPEAIEVPEPGKASDDALFPRYAVLKPNVTFWTKVFAEYSENQAVVHFMDHPDKIFEIVDMRDAAAQMSKEQFHVYRREAENRAKARAEGVLARVHAARNSPETLSGDERRMFKLFADVEGDNRFKNAFGTIRTQRGLRERTQLALETSGRYLPAMEAVFRGYGLPVRLTRLPLVESSFNVDAYSKVGAAGLWQFMPASARHYMRLDSVVDDRRDPWTSTDAAARHLKDDYEMLGQWPLALTAYNHGRGGIARGLSKVGGTALPDLIRRYESKSFGFASKNFYAEFLAASDVERNWQKHFGNLQRNAPIRFDTVQTRDYVPYATLARISNADEDTFRRLNPAYRPEVMTGKFYVPPGHSIRVPAGSAKTFEVAYAQLGDGELFAKQRTYWRSYKVRKGDSLSRIARKFGVTQSSIRDASGLTAKAKLRAGQTLKIPPAGEKGAHTVEVALDESNQGSLTTPEAGAKKSTAKKSTTASTPSKPAYRTHKVRSGQTLSSIAKRYSVSISELRSANGLGSSSHLSIGQRLRVPS
ncbi:MAG TPA: LysM peptidoglycan-binding domain-containing protein [Nevskiaceae bacterium]|nr:LysM peptidoglycan-binding domain-containing protein [Nevskiaceae bacterium]